MNKIRLKYSKTGTAKYISHLDFMSVMQRALLRAGIELKYSEGFNPHPFLSVALPLSVGFGSVCELMDIGIVGDKLPDINSILLPQGIEILDVYRPLRKFNDIQWIELHGEMFYDDVIVTSEPQSPGINNLSARLTDVYKKDSIIISKRSKRGEKEIDIAPFIKDIVFDVADNKITLSAKISAQNPTLNVNDLLNPLDKSLKPCYTGINRIELYDTNMVQFR